MNKLTQEHLTQQIIDEINHHKGENTIVIDTKEKNSLADYIIVTTGTSARHVASIADKVFSCTKGKTKKGARIEGLREGRWILIDLDFICIHIFQREVRDLYKIEDLWNKNIYTIK